VAVTDSRRNLRPVAGLVSSIHEYIVIACAMHLLEFHKLSPKDDFDDVVRGKFGYWPTDSCRY
jgi:hypothetical protein